MIHLTLVPSSHDNSSLILDEFIGKLDQILILAAESKQAAREGDLAKAFSTFQELAKTVQSA